MWLVGGFGIGEVSIRALVWLWGVGCGIWSASAPWFLGCVFRGKNQSPELGDGREAGVLRERHGHVVQRVGEGADGVL